MTTASTYQVAFKFQFQQGFSNKQIQVDITDANSFLIDSGKQAQLEPYMASDTPPLLSFTLSNQQLFLNVGNGVTGSGIEGILWSTFSTNGNAQTLDLNVTFPGGLVTAYYAVLGSSSSGQLHAGNNTLTVGS